MTDKWLTLDNGMKYNPKTGETVLEGENPDNPTYRFNPNAVGGAKTYFNGNTYTGKYDPYVIGQITGQNLSSAGNKYEDYLNSMVSKVEKNPFLKTEKNITDALKQPANTYGNLTFSKAYDEARKKFQGDTFFDQAKQLDKGPTEQKAPYMTEDQNGQIENNPNLSPAVKSAILGGYENWQNKPSTPVQPTKPSQPTQTTQPIQPDKNASPNASGLDWKALYDQLSGYLTQQQASTGPPSPSGTPVAKQQIGSFQQFGPTIARRQQSYGSSTPSSKAG